jgi:hypothetical protein
MVNNNVHKEGTKIAVSYPDGNYTIYKKRRTCEINIRIDLITTGSYFVAVERYHKLVYPQSRWL